jgi:CBS domain-containing protein
MLDLIAISKESQVVYLEKTSAFNVNDQPHSSFYIVKDGAVGLSISYDEKKFLSINVMRRYSRTSTFFLPRIII